MKIDHSNLLMESKHDLQVQHHEMTIQRTTIAENVAKQQSPQVTALVRHESASERPESSDDVHVTLTQSAGMQYSHHATDTYAAAAIVEEEENAPASEQRAKLMVLLKTMEKITGKAYHFSEIQFNRDTGDASKQILADYEGSAPSPQPPPAAPTDDRTRQVETITEYRHYERERTGFSAAGVVQTAEGREIDINVQLNMSREFYEENITYRVETGPLTDPLIVNFDGNAADLTGKKYSFDLNSDGVEEKISFVTPDAGGFLVHDRNKDGQINNGSELFGPSQGDGFSELAVHDEDGNGWIDETDSIFYDLAVWTKTSEGDDQLIALADTGLGAIYLNAAATPFSITTKDNETLGLVRSTSIYLNEDGSAGIIQQVDLSTAPDSRNEQDGFNTVI